MPNWSQSVLIFDVKLFEGLQIPRRMYTHINECTHTALYEWAKCFDVQPQRLKIARRMSTFQ